MTNPADHPLLRLTDDDRNMVVAFVLASGSIKDLAKEYGVSYPTMRQRLNGLIDRLRQSIDGRDVDPLSDYLARLIADGRLAPDAASSIRRLHREALSSTPSPADGADS